MVDFKFSWQGPEAEPDSWAQELKGFNPNQSRSKDGRFGIGEGRSLVGQVYLDAQKVAGHHKITVHSGRVKKYAGHETVESFIAGHKRGRAAAMRELTSDHATGKISFGHPETGESPAAARPKKAPVVKTKIEANAVPEKLDATDHAAVKAEAGRRLRGVSIAKPGASLKPIARDPNRSDIDTLKVAHAHVADSGDAARLSHVRAVLGNYSRPEQDRMLQGALMSSPSSGVSLSQISDQKAIDKTEEGARHHSYELLRATHRGLKSVDDTDDLDVIDAVTPAEVADLFDGELLASAGYV